MSITVGRLELAHPLLNASGTWDAVEAQRLFDMRTKLIATARELDEGGAGLMRLG